VADKIACAPSAPPQVIAPACHGEVCITCSDEAVQARVVEVLPGAMALVDARVGGDGLPEGEGGGPQLGGAGGSGAEEVSVALVDAAVGDVVLVHAKEAIAVLARTDLTTPSQAGRRALGTSSPARPPAPPGRPSTQCA
jgi:hypothetical protein